MEGIRFLEEGLAWLKDCPYVLDVGCGDGTVVRWLRANGHTAEGITYQRKEVTPETRFGDAHAIPFPSKTFDGLLSWDCLEHTLSPFIALKEAWRVLKKGGRAAYFVPGEAWQEERYHIIVPTFRQMHHLLKLSGWASAEVIDCSKEDGPRGLLGDGAAVYLLTK